MRPEVFLEITQGSEEFSAVAAVERLAVVKSKVGSESVPGVEGLLASIFGALEGLNFGVNPDVDLQRVRSQERFAASVLRTLEAIFTC